MADGYHPSFEGDAPAAADSHVLPDRRELAIVAVERSRMPMVITDPRQPDNPIVLANAAFLELTGYSPTEVIGRNCRFMQGPDTDRATIEQLRRELAERKDHVAAEILNYRKDGTTFWNQLAISAVHDAAGQLLYYFASQKDVTSRRDAQRLERSERQLLMEVDHRAMNALALVQSIVKLTRADSVERFSASIRGRVDALARAHRLLANSSWSAADLDELIVLEGGRDGYDRSGPRVLLAPRFVQPLSLIFHEMFANAREYGALSGPSGRLAIAWTAQADELVIRWVEDGAREVSQDPPTMGMGLKLINGIVAGQLGGRCSHDWSGVGLETTLTVPWTLRPGS
jgi:PAS domain S-box-containing protein